MRFGLLAALWTGLLFGQVSFGADLPPWMTDRRIIGNNDLEPIEKTAGTTEYDRARVVARVETSDGTGFCTGSRLSKDIFLTNYHCFEFAACDNLRFHLGYEKDLPASQQLIFKCKEVLSKSLNLDYALYRVEFVGGLEVTSEKVVEQLAVGLDVPDNSPVGVAQVLDVDLPGRVVSLDLGLRVNHKRAADLKVRLRSPGGEEVELSTASAVTATGIDHLFSQADGLAGFAGKPALGQWELIVVDGAQGETGELIDVILTVKTATESDSQAAPEQYPTAVLWDGPLEINQQLIVASHPRARLKEIDRSATCVIRTIETEVVNERQTITHTCDTEGGSSGSPVLDRATGRIVALHWGGTNEYNLSIPMYLIVADLKKQLSESVFAELTIDR